MEELKAALHGATVRVVYIAKHGSGGNDDEGAIAHSLTRLGCEVVKLQEATAHSHMVPECDFVLFHKWTNFHAIVQLSRRCKLVFWYFDLVQDRDNSNFKRSRSRRQWMQAVVPHVHAGFCTDGDWVAQDGTGKLKVLRQGADERYIGHGTPQHRQNLLLFTGTRYAGDARASFVLYMEQKYGLQFKHINSGLHGRQLADAIASSKIVLAPDAPVTHNYWSNRVYLSLGFGAFMLHPRCHDLLSDYKEWQEIACYSDRSELHQLVEWYTTRPDLRMEIAEAGYARTIKEHLYTHRVARLLECLKPS